MFWLKDLQKKIEELAKESAVHHKDNDLRLDNIEKVLLAQEINLKTHMKRSEHLEEIVNQMKIQTEKDMAPLKKHINMIEGALKFLGIVGLIITILGGLSKLFGLI